MRIVCDTELRQLWLGVIVKEINICKHCSYIERCGLQDGRQETVRKVEVDSVSVSVGFLFFSCHLQYFRNTLLARASFISHLRILFCL
jgi:hypothetical protein